jgi:uncharacterized protein (TIGR03118 family)
MQRWFNRTLRIALTLGLALIFASAAFAQFTETILDTNLPGKGMHTDPLLVNAWGLAYGPGGPFWISDEGSGWSTLYDGSGNPQSLQVVVPGANGGTGSPTGIVYNGSSQFQIDSWPSEFMFATIDGTIQGWSHFSPSASLIAINNSASGAVYTGLAVTNHSSGNDIYACNIATGLVEMYDGNFNLVKTFTDTGLPKGAAVPFGIQDINGTVYVAFAAANGGPNGVIDEFSESGTLIKRLIKGSPLNQPWGIAMAPSNFGALSNTLLISNNTNAGTINGFNPTTGAFVAAVTGSNGKAITITQLWGIEFGGGSSENGQTNQLFFTAGPPASNADGEFGYIQPATAR